MTGGGRYKSGRRALPLCVGILLQLVPHPVSALLSLSFARSSPLSLLFFVNKRDQMIPVRHVVTFKRYYHATSRECMFNKDAVVVVVDEANETTLWLLTFNDRL